MSVWVCQLLRGLMERAQSIEAQVAEAQARIDTEKEVGHGRYV